VHLLHQELGCQETNLIGHGVAVLEGTGLIRDVTLYDTYYLLLGNRNVGLTDAVADVLDGNSFAVRRIQRLIDVVDELGVGIVEAVELEDDVLSQTGSRRTDTTGSGQEDMIVVANLRCRKPRG